MTPDPWCTAKVHGGDYTSYVKGCRCGPARAANAARSRARRAGCLPIVDATGVRRRLQALAAAGWSLNDLAAALYVNRNVVHRWQTFDMRIHERNARRVADLYDRIGLDEGRSAQSRSTAARHGWPPPIEWDDANIDDPKARPLDVDGPPRYHERAVPFVDIELLVMSGETWERACSRLGIAKEALDRRLRRNGRADLVHRLSANSQVGELRVRREFGVYARRSA